MTIRRTARTTLAAAACTGVLAVGLAACGTVQQLGAAQKVSGAFGKLADGKTFRAELSVEATPDQLIAFSKASGDPVKPQEAATLAELTLGLSVSSDKPLKDVASFKKAQESGDFSALAEEKGLDIEYVLAGKSGKTYVDLRVVGSKPYLKVDAEGLVKLAGKDPSEVRAMADQVPPELKIVKDALTGKWVSVDPKLLQELGKDPSLGALTGGAGATPSAKSSVDPKAVQGVLTSIEDVLSHNLTFEDKGTKDGAEHIVASGPARGLADGLLNAVQPLVKDLPKKGAPLPSKAPTSVPDRKVAADLYLKDGALSSVSFDLAQLDEKAGPDVHFPVKIAFSKDVAPLQAPTGATEFGMADIKNVMGIFTQSVAAKTGQGLPGHSGKPATPLTDAQLKELSQSGMPEAQLKLMNQNGLSYQDIKQLLDSKN